MQKITQIGLVTMLGLLVVACDSKPKFDVINDNNVTAFVAASIDDAGSGAPSGSNIDLSVSGFMGMYRHPKKGSDAPDMGFPDPYEYVMVICGNLADEVEREGRLTNQSPLVFLPSGDEGDPAFKLGIDVCEID